MTWRLRYFEDFHGRPRWVTYGKFDVPLLTTKKKEAACFRTHREAMQAEARLPLMILADPEKEGL